MLRVKVFPSVDFLIAFVQTRGFLVVNDKPNILHYAGTNEKELKSLIKEDKPDLIIMNSKYFSLSGIDVFWVYHPTKSEKELYNTKKIYTNNFRLCQLYFQKLGLQAEISLIQKQVETKKTNELEFVYPVALAKTFWNKFCSLMSWN